jgi:hypothetical protein
MTRTNEIFVVDYGPKQDRIGKIIHTCDTIADAEKYLTENPDGLPDIEAGRYSIDGTAAAWIEQTGEGEEE